MSTDLLEGLTKEELLAELGERMRLLSEEATGCGWDFRVSEEIPRLCYEALTERNGVDYRGVTIPRALARWLVAIAERLGHWVELDGKGGWAAHVPEAMKRRRND